MYTVKREHSEAGPKCTILDFGYVQYIDHMGTDKSVIEAARMSTDKGFLGWEPGPCPICRKSGVLPNQTECYACEGKGEIRGDKHLLAYLYNGDPPHATPFEFGQVVIEIQCPIFVVREWHRHRTQSYNEMSARYTPLPNLHYIPSTERLLMAGINGNKQANTLKGSKIITTEYADNYRTRLHYVNLLCQQLYEEALDNGIAKELARLPNNVNRYTRFRASANLRNWLGFMTLRDDPKAQWEIQQYAKQVGRVLSELFPRVWNLYDLKRETKLAK